MNICHVITRLIVGGAQENTVLTCAGLHEKGHQVTLITGPDTGPEGSLLDEARGYGFDVRIVSSLHRAIQPRDDLRARRELSDIFREIGPDVVHTHSSKAGILGRFAARRAFVPIVVHTIHGMSFNRTQRPWVRAAYRFAEQRAAAYTTHFVTVADAMTQQAVDAGIATPDRFTTVYSGMRTEWFDPAAHDRAAVRRQWGFPENAVVAGTVARLFANKGYEQLIPAMQTAIRNSPALHFVWVGDGSHRDTFLQQLGQLGIRDRVHLTGLIRPEAVPAVLAGVDFVVHPSQWEGLPRAAVQGLLMGKPVISFDVDGAPEVVEHEQTGLLVPLNDVSGLAGAMTRLAEEADLRERMGHIGRSRCLERFDHQTMINSLDALYKRLSDPIANR